MKKSCHTIRKQGKVNEQEREQWTASVTYVFQEKVRNEELAVNPLGLTIVRFRADQAFE